MSEVALPSDNHRQLAAVPPPEHDTPPSALLQWVEEARQANVIAGALAQSSFIPQSLRGKPQDITAAILTGQEIGMQPMAALRSLDVIQGTPALRANAMRALLQSKGHEIELVESTPEKCVMRGRRYNGPGREPGSWQEITWDMDRARGLALAGKDNWKKQPQAMLVARATGEICRLVASDVLHALAYASEELRDATSAPASAQRVTVAQLTGRPEPAVVEQQHDEPAPDVDEPTTAARRDKPTVKQIGLIHGLAEKLGLDTKTERDEYLALLSAAAGRDITSSTDLTKAEATDVIDTWTVRVEQAPVDGVVEEDRDAIWERVKAGAKQRGFTSAKQLQTAIEEKYAQPLDDITDAQLVEFTGLLALGTIKVPE